MWLKFGVSPAGELLGVDEGASGKTKLTCLYCGGPLTARKGKVKKHHFVIADLNHCANGRRRPQTVSGPEPERGQG